MGILKRAKADPTMPDDRDVDYYRAEGVSTDTSGAVAAQTINFDEAFDAAPDVLSVGVTDAQGEAHVNAIDTDSADVDVVNGPASSTVDIALIVAGERNP